MFNEMFITDVPGDRFNELTLSETAGHRIAHATFHHLPRTLFNQRATTLRNLPSLARAQLVVSTGLMGTSDILQHVPGDGDGMDSRPELLNFSFEF